MWKSFIRRIVLLFVARKNSNTKIKIAIAALLVAVGIGIASFSEFESKTTTSVSLGNDREFPMKTLQSDAGTYYVDMIVETRGTEEASTIITVNGENAQVRVGTMTGWNYKHTLPFTTIPDAFQKKYPLYVNPDDDTSFTIMLSLETPEDLESHEIELHHPSILTFEYDGENFVLTEQR